MAQAILQTADGPAQPRLLAAARSHADQALKRVLPSADQAPARLHAAMRYSVFAPGKRLRPALVLASFAASGGAAPDAGCPARDARWAACQAAMAAIELIHTYTLIHDDLPAMDDDDLRRGQPTCHRAFDEATAILAGDALQALAFATVAELGTAGVRVLAAAAGSLGVVGGQQEDLDAEGLPLRHDAEAQARVERIHRGKTAALIAAACELGGLAAAAAPEQLARLRGFGTELGIAFQIADDLLDTHASAAALGKTPGKDAQQGKWTYVSVHGEAAARSAAERHLQAALALLPGLAGQQQDLVDLARFVVQRTW